VTRKGTARRQSKSDSTWAAAASTGTFQQPVARKDRGCRTGHRYEQCLPFREGHTWWAAGGGKETSGRVLSLSFLMDPADDERSTRGKNSALREVVGACGFLEIEHQKKAKAAIALF
jgi:hypothetical protein